MNHNASGGAATARASACVVAGVYQGGRPPPATTALDKASHGRLLGRSHPAFRATSGESLLLGDIPGLKAKHVLLVGLGPRRDFGMAALRKSAATTVRALEDARIGGALSLLAELPVTGMELETRLQALVQASEHAAYRFEQMKSRATDEAKPRLKRLSWSVSTGDDVAAARRGIAAGAAIAGAEALTRDLSNLPANVCTPRYLAEQARRLGEKYPALQVNVLDENAIQKLGMGALWGVARASREPPRLIVFEYAGGKRNDRPVVLVGKGITFDSGGISIKPSAKMDEMKFDMCGAASVFGALAAACELALPINLVGITPAAENLPGGNAVKPGDILTTLSGQTVEVLNTDAEGRLILCDALCYAERFQPRVVVDMATLTGACVVALGQHASGLMSPDDALAAELLAAGERAGDRAWRLPLWEDYQSELKSNFADFANVGGREGGAIIAGCFLWRFAKKFRWAHLDIAGTAWLSGEKKGATGRPVPLLVEWLMDLASAE
ncbi:MAG TPA: leucyl aminopeptidase [Gammaproteobacteria bacterium]|nr:leucyl aminopeptidase [Gammaproteobacteria bacterium]